VVTHQLQVERRTAKASRPKTDVLPLGHAQPNALVAFGALTLLVGRQERHLARKNMGDDGGGHW